MSAGTDMDALSCATPLGKVLLVCDGDALVRLYLPGCLPEPMPVELETPALLRFRQALEEYFSTGRIPQGLNCRAEGTPFQRAVWNALRQIPDGETRTYGQLAAQLGYPPGAARAVGQACHRNPIPILIPCHRVVGASGKLTGFAGGLEQKEFLLRLEQKVPR